MQTKDVPYSDEKLLLRLRDGDYRAFDELYERYAGITLTKLRKLVHIPEVAEELHQDVFMKIWEQRERLPIDISPKAIVFRKARSLAYNFYRKATLDQNLYEQLISVSTELYDQIEDYINFTETQEAIQTAIAKLTLQRQKVFARIKFDGKSYEETANEFGISLSTVKDHMTRALKFLRSEMISQHPSSLFIILAATVFR